MFLRRITFLFQVFPLVLHPGSVSWAAPAGMNALWVTVKNQRRKSDTWNEAKSYSEFSISEYVYNTYRAKITSVMVTF